MKAIALALGLSFARPSGGSGSTPPEGGPFTAGLWDDSTTWDDTTIWTD